MDIYRYMLRKNLVYAIIVAFELVAVYSLLNLSFSLLLQSGNMYGDGDNTDSMTLFSYIAVAAVALYFFTVAIQNVVGYERTSRFYQICIAMGATKKSLVKAKAAYTFTVYGCAFVLGAIICLALDVKEAKDGIGLKFFTYAGHGLTFAVYIVLTAINIAADIFFVKKADALKELLGGTDNV